MLEMGGSPAPPPPSPSPPRRSSSTSSSSPHPPPGLSASLLSPSPIHPAVVSTQSRPELTGILRPQHWPPAWAWHPAPCLSAENTPRVVPAPRP